MDRALYSTIMPILFQKFTKDETLIYSFDVRTGQFVPRLMVDPHKSQAWPESCNSVLSWKDSRLLSIMKTWRADLVYLTIPGSGALDRAT